MLGLDIDKEPAALVPKLGGDLGQARHHQSGHGRHRRASPLASFSPCAASRPKWPGLLIARCRGIGALPLPSISMWRPSAPASAACRARCQRRRYRRSTSPRCRPFCPMPLAIALLGSIESLAVGGGGRRHDRPPASLQLRAGRAGHGQHRRRRLRRHVRHRHHRPHGDQCSRRRHRPRLGHAARRLSSCSSCSLPLRWPRYIPLASLGAVLAVVAWNMAEKEEFASLLRSSWGDAIVLTATFLLTIFEDLTIAIGVGVTLAPSCSCTAWRKPWRSRPAAADRRGCSRRHRRGAHRLRSPCRAMAMSSSIAFPAPSSSAPRTAVSGVLDRIGEQPKVFVLDFSGCAAGRQHGAKALEAFVHKLDASGTRVYFAGARKSFAAAFSLPASAPARALCRVGGRRHGPLARHLRPELELSWAVDNLRTLNPTLSPGPIRRLPRAVL